MKPITKIILIGVIVFFLIVVNSIFPDRYFSSLINNKCKGLSEGVCSEDPNCIGSGSAFRAYGEFGEKWILNYHGCIERTEEDDGCIFHDWGESNFGKSCIR